MNQLDLDKPADAFFFLRSVKIKGMHIQFVGLDNGKELAIDDMTDEQAVRYAKDIYFDYCGGIEGKEREIELDPPKDLN